MVFKKLHIFNKKTIATSFAITMIIGSVFSGSSSAKETSSDELLDVGFGGAFSSEEGYTNPSGEIVDGSLTQRTGEENIVRNRVYLNGGQDGIDFNPRVSLGTDTLDKSIIVETEFKPKENPGHYETLISIGGNLYVRYIDSDTIEYGFDINHDGGWSSETETVSVTELDEASKIAIAYEPEDSGAKMQVFMDGEELPSVSSDNGRPPLDDTDSVVGFGNELKPGHKDRGFEGAISKAILTQFEGAFKTSLLKTQDVFISDLSLLMYGLGDLEHTTYSVSVDETADGDIDVNGGEITEPGKIKLNGNDSNITFKPTETIGDKDLDNGYVGEIIFDPSDIKNETVLFDLAGGITVRQSADEADAMDVLVNGEINDTIDISNEIDEDKETHLAIIYQNVDDEMTIRLLLDEEQVGEDIKLSHTPKAERNSVMFAGTDNKDLGNDLTGEVDGVSFTSLESEFSKDMLALEKDFGTIPDNLEPGQRIDIDSNDSTPVLSAKASQVRPKPKQVTWQQYEKTAFLHYGINTYNEVEWGGFDLDPNDFQPTDLDTDQWARSLKESGFELAMLTVKHHDGFLLYPSRYTDFSVANSSWKDGEGDVLREFVDSMRKYDLDVGVYLSPADHQAYSDGIFANGSSRSEREIPTLVDGDNRKDNPDFPSMTLPGTDYGEFFMNQLYEVLTEYGEIDEVWFDGAQGRIPGGAEEKYDMDSYYELINELQPQAVIANQGDDVRWVGNESGFARDNEWSVVGAARDDKGNQYTHPGALAPDIGSLSALVQAAKNGMDYLTWYPAEVDVSIRDGWFYHEDQQPKSVEKLRDIYYDSVARNSVLLLNVPPNKEGKLADEDVNILKEWHKSIEQDLTINHAKDARISDDNGVDEADPENVIDDNYDTSWQMDSTEPGSITFDFDEEVDVDRVILQEDINKGQQVQSFAIDVLNDNEEWEKVYTNGTIGYKRIATFSDTVTGKKFRVRILDSRGPVHLSEIGLYETSSEIEVPVSNISDLETLVEQMEEDGEFSDDAASIRTLKRHLTSLKRFEDTKQNEKVIKHLKTLKIMLDKQKKEEVISDKAYNQILAGVNKLIDKKG